MNRTTRALLTTAAFAGIITGSIGCAQSDKSGAGTEMKNADAAKHACKGQNACKGQGGCHTDKNARKGQNACKGQGGCKTA